MKRSRNAVRPSFEPSRSPRPFSRHSRPLRHFAPLASEASRYASDQAAIKLEAKRIEHERDAKSAEADVLLAQHHYFAVAVALFQIAIALGAVSALTRIRLVWIASLMSGLAGLAAGAWPYLHPH